MTTLEFNKEFDILYNNISSNSAPGLDLYEKSYYLTKAQLEIVKEYNGLLNKHQKGFDGSEKRRIDLKELIVDYKTTDFTTSTNSITTSLNSKFFKIPQNLFLIKYEKGHFKYNSCELELDIIPITLDEFNEKLKNPFKKPYKKVAWRLDFNSNNNNQVEIVSDQNITLYHIRYLKFPSPIILTDLLNDPEFIGMNLTLYGQTSEQTCLLNQEIHQEILDRAVELAHRDYKENTLQNKVQLNNRNN